MDNNDKEQEQNENALRAFQEIQYDMSKASLEDVKNILDLYNKDSVIANYVNPMDAACLNARFLALTGQNHPTFLKAQLQILNELIETEPVIIIDGEPSIYQKLKNNITGEGPGISILLNKNDNFIVKFDKIKFNISKANLEDVTDILNYYDQESVLIDGMQYHARPSALDGACLNARYHELTGQDHPTFLEAQPQILDKLIETESSISIDGQPSIYEALKKNTIPISNSDDVINRTYQILSDIQKAKLQDISSLLDSYNGHPVLIDGIVVHPFNSPTVAEKLNKRYFELTGQDHPTFLEQTPKVIDGLMKDKDILLRSGGEFNPQYFDHLNQMLQYIKTKKDESNKTTFSEERQKQRNLDDEKRNQQIKAMSPKNQNPDLSKYQTVDEEASIGGMSK